MCNRCDVTVSNPLKCTECDTFLSRYESATSELVGVYDALEVAADMESILRLTAEARSASARQRIAQIAFADHCNAIHERELKGCMSGDRHTTRCGGSPAGSLPGREEAVS